MYRSRQSSRSALTHLTVSGAALALGIGLLAGCVSTRETVQRHEDHLIAAGFVERPANTPKRQEILKRLPSNRFVKRVHGDDVHYVYADPLVCDCLYVGTQQAYSEIQGLPAAEGARR